MEWLVENWYLIIAAIAIVALGVYAAIKFIKQPWNTKIKNLKEWLKWAVSKAEKELGSGTGQLKLRLVYNMAIEKFPFITNFVSFETFAAWVDEALEWMNKQLKTNVNISNFVNGGDNIESTDNIQ